MNRTSAFKLFLIGLLSLTTNVMAQAQAKSDSMAKFGISIPDAYSITTINSSKIGFMTQQKSKSSNTRYILVENGRIDSIGKKRTGTYMGNDVFEIQSLFLAPDAGVDTIKIMVQDAQNNVYQTYSFPRNPSILTFTGVDKKGNPQSVSIIHEWRGNNKIVLQRTQAYAFIYFRDFTKRVVRSGAPLDLNQPIRVKAFFNGEEVDIKSFSLRDFEYNPNYLTFTTHKPLLDVRSVTQFRMQLERMRTLYLVILDQSGSKDGEKIEYPFFEIAYEDFYPTTQTE